VVDAAHAPDVDDVPVRLAAPLGDDRSLIVGDFVQPEVQSGGEHRQRLPDRQMISLHGLAPQPLLWRPIDAEEIHDGTRCDISVTRSHQMRSTELVTDDSVRGSTSMQNPGFTPVPWTLTPWAMAISSSRRASVGKSSKGKTKPAVVTALTPADSAEHSSSQLRSGSCLVA